MSSKISSMLWQRIRAARKNKRWRQIDLANAVNVSRTTVSLWEASDSDRSLTPTDTNLIGIAEVTGCPYQWLASDQSQLSTDSWEHYRTTSPASSSIDPNLKDYIDQRLAHSKQLSPDLLALMERADKAMGANPGNRTKLLAIIESAVANVELFAEMPD